MTTATGTRRESPARRRILDTATALFYAEGVHAVGIDRIIAEAGVAKATFYHHFPAKDQLVRAYLEEQSRQRRDAVTALPAASPRQTALAMFDAIGELAQQSGYRGCPFLNAAAEYPDPASPVRQAIDDHRRWTREFVRGLLVADGQRDPGRTADILIALGDGLLIGSHLDDSAELTALIHDAVNRVLGAPRKATRGSRPRSR